MARKTAKKTTTKAARSEPAPMPAAAEENALPSLDGKRIAILCTDGVEQIELTSPRKALEDAGAQTVLIAPHAGSIKGWNFADWGDEFEVDMAVPAAMAEAYEGKFDGLHLPGGPLNGDTIRGDATAAMFVAAFFAKDLPVGAICHALWILAEADVLHDRQLTSFPAIATDLRNAGATWLNQPTVLDRGLLTARHPGDLPMYNDALVRLFAS